MPGYKANALFISMMVLPCFIAASCDGEADLNSSTGIEPNRPITLSDIQKSWKGEYEGWDSLQNIKTKIRRELVLNADGTYSNIIGAVMYTPNIEKEVFALVEKEGGRYEFNEKVRAVKYIVAFDSLVDFSTQSFVGYTKKQYRNTDGSTHEQEEYAESVKFTLGKKGTVRWETVDSTLFSLDGKGAPIIYYMDAK